MTNIEKLKVLEKELEDLNSKILVTNIRMTDAKKQVEEAKEILRTLGFNPDDLEASLQEINTEIEALFSDIEKGLKEVQDELNKSPN